MPCGQETKTYNRSNGTVTNSIQTLKILKKEAIVFYLVKNEWTWAMILNVHHRVKNER